MIEFARLVASGSANAVAYRAVYNPKLANQTAAERGCRLAKHPAVAAEMARLREKSERKKLLTLNDRLEILADISRDPKARPHEKARAIEVYSKISGDQAPDRHEISGPNGAPIPVAGEVVVLSRRDKLAAIKGRRAAL